AGFKPEHFAAIAAAPQPVGFFEIHAENYMGAGGIRHAQLKFIRENYALSLHGVGLNIGSSERLDRADLARLKDLCERYQPECFSEHLAWSSHGGIYFSDLLPLPYNDASLRSVIEHVDETQSAATPPAYRKSRNLCALCREQHSRDRVFDRDRA